MRFHYYTQDGQEIQRDAILEVVSSRVRDFTDKQLQLAEAAAKKYPNTDGGFMAPTTPRATRFTVIYK